MNTWNSLRPFKGRSWVIGRKPSGRHPRGLSVCGWDGGRDSPWIPVIFNGFSREEKGWELSLYRLPASCHAGSLIPAVRFLRKEKSSLLRAGYFLRRRKHGRKLLRSQALRGGILCHDRNPSTTVVPLVRRRSPLPYVPSERITREASRLCASVDAFFEFKRMSGS